MVLLSIEIEGEFACLIFFDPYVELVQLRVFLRQRNAKASKAKRLMANQKQQAARRLSAILAAGTEAFGAVNNQCGAVSAVLLACAKRR